VSYLDESLTPGETVLYRTGLHWSTVLGSLLLGALLALGAIALLVASFRFAEPGTGPTALRVAGCALVVLGAVAIVSGLVRRSAVEMAVTNRRVLMKTGLFARRTTELMLSKVESIGVEQGVAGRLWGYGTVVVRGTGGTHEVFARIDRPLEFRRQVQQQIQQFPSAAEPMARPGSA
jgi:uncharacterized membrane protein YdbT with pleckstrin-like domain